MTKRLRGFRSADVVACFDEPNETGAWNDIDAPRNAPAKTPSAYLDKIAFHSDFFNYELALAQTVNVTHPAVPTTTVSWGFPGVLEVSIQGGTYMGETVLLNHGLPYTPLVMVAYGAAMVVAGTVVQLQTEGVRFVSVWADGTSVGLGECAYGNIVDLPAANRSYEVLVFRTPAPDPAKPLFSGGASQFQIGRGMIDSSKRYLRRDNGGSPFDMDFGRTIDIFNGGARVITGGNVQTEAHYTGSFTGGGYLPVGV